MSKPDSADTPNQSIYEDDQNFDINISDLYNSWIVPIDNLRSLAGITQENAQIFKALQKGGTTDITSITSLIKMETTVQESRCHAFYRWIGFPVTDNSKNNIYNPGFDIIKSSTRTITIAKKISTATNQVAGFEDLSLKREQFIRQNLDIFSENTTIDAAVLALSNGGNSALRDFSSVFDKSSGDAFDVNTENQSSQIDLTALVGEIETPLTVFQDSGGGFPTKLTNKRYHIITPFIVDARIDFAVSPQERLIAVPFVNDATQLKLHSVKSVNRPLIELFIRKRFAADTSKNLGTAVETINQIVASYQNIKDDSLIQKVTDPNTILQPPDQIVLAETINSIKSLMRKLVDAQIKIGEVQGQYYFVPVPSVNGPEQGCSIQGIFYPTIINPSLVTDNDAEIFFAVADTTLNNPTSEGSKATGESDVASYGLPSYNVTFGDDTTDSMGDNSTQNKDSLSQIRTRKLTEACEALQTVEIIMGDFSGLGLADIIAIIGALNTVAKEDLLGFLDADALTRAQASMPVIKNSTPTAYPQAMANLTSTVKDFYSLMDKIYQDTIDNSASTT